MIDTKAEIVTNVKPTQKGFVRNRTDHDFFNVKDINIGENFYVNGKPQRQTNPLEPRYNVSGQKGYG